jgi:hypothetical protein
MTIPLGAVAMLIFSAMFQIAFASDDRHNFECILDPVSASFNRNRFL